MSRRVTPATAPSPSRARQMATWTRMAARLPAIRSDTLKRYASPRRKAHRANSQRARTGFPCVSHPAGLLRHGPAAGPGIDLLRLRRAAAPQLHVEVPDHAL